MGLSVSSTMWMDCLAGTAGWTATSQAVKPLALVSPAEPAGHRQCRQSSLSCLPCSITSASPSDTTSLAFCWAAAISVMAVAAAA